MPLRRLTCCVCGDDAGRWEQHWNRDTGYGVCSLCIIFVQDESRHHPESPEEVLSFYGKAGVNYEMPTAAHRAEYRRRRENHASKSGAEDSVLRP